MQQQITKKKKKRKEVLLLVDFECLTDEEVMKTIHQIRVSLIKIFKGYIGEENSITPHELFEKVYGINPNMLDIFKRQYWWNVLKKVMSGLRKDETLFVINKGTKLFVLCNQKELDYFKTKIERDIVNLKGVEKKAEEWVKEEKWRKL